MRVLQLIADVVRGDEICLPFRASRAILEGEEMPEDSQSGFALVVVIWAIGLLALMFVTYIAAARHRSIEALSLSERASAEAMANQGINIAVLDLLAGLSDGLPSSTRFRHDGTPALCMTADGSRMAIFVVDEGGKVDLNAASPELIQALMRGLHAGEKIGSQLAKTILTLRDEALASQSSQGIASPTAAAFKTVLELDQLTRGNQFLYPSLRALVTVHSRGQGFDPRVAPIGVLAAISPRGEVPSRSEARRALPTAFVADSQGRAFTISSEAMTVKGARFARDAVVEFSRAQPSGYYIREWHEGSLRLPDLAEGILPPC
jgi:general secretion pathway protein K